MRRTDRFALVASAACWLVTGPVIAQRNGTGDAWVRADPRGVPMLLSPIELVAGHTYEIQTFATSAADAVPIILHGVPVLYADPVLSIRAGTGVLQGTLGGSDSCTTPGSDPNDFWDACVRLNPPRTGTYWIWVRAAVGALSGRTSLRAQDLTANGCTSPTSCVPNGNAWNTLVADVAFGGFTVRGVGGVGPSVDGAPAYQFETAERPGDTGNSLHAIMTTYSEPLLDWYISRNRPLSTDTVGSGGPGSHRTHVRLTAEYRGRVGTPLDHTLVIAAPLFALGAGPFRLMRNDCVVGTPSCIARRVRDIDGDTLGSALEAALLTCDSQDSPDAGGLRCRDRTGCTVVPSTLCAQSHRDSDGDGYRDDLELYGYQFTRPALEVGGAGYLPRYGASPAHYDVFAEIDYVGGDGTYDPAGRFTPAPSCDPVIPLGNPLGIALAPLQEMANVYARDTTLRNRDGIDGIAAHFDSVLAIGSTLPLRTETRTGNWGGSSCVFQHPACTSDASCPGARTGSCCNPGRTTRADTCDGGAVPPGRCRLDANIGEDRAYYAGPRRWLFRTLRWDGGGGTSLEDRISAVGSATVSVHELAHQGNLAHGGPARARFGQNDANYSFAHDSRINYLFQDVGGTDLGDPAEASRVSFSVGHSSPVRSLDAVERCAFGPMADTAARSPYGLLARYTALGSGGATFAAGGHVCLPGDTDAICGPIVGDALCRGAVDWNRDGAIAPAGATVEAAVLVGPIARTQRTPHFYPDHTPPRWVSEVGAQLVAIGGALVRVRVEGQRVGSEIRPRLVLNRTRRFTCSPDPAPLAAGFRWPDCDLVGVEYPALIDGLPSSHAAAIEPLAVAAAGSRVGGVPVVVIVWIPLSAPTTLRYGILSNTGEWTPAVGNIPLPTGGLASLTNLEGIPGLARIGTSDDLTLMLRDGDGNISEVVGHPAGGDITWTLTAVSPIPGGFFRFVSAVGVTNLPPTTLLPATYGALLVVGAVAVGPATHAGDPLVLFARDTPSGLWDFIGIVAQADPITDQLGVRGRPSMAARPYRIGTSSGDRTGWRLIVSFQVAGVVQGPQPTSARYLESGMDDLSSWSLGDDFFNLSGSSISSPTGVALAWDDATGPGAHGLRGEFDRTTVGCTDRVPDRSCPPGRTCCEAGADCRALPGSLPTPNDTRGCVAHPIAGTETHLVQADVVVVPGADGVAPFTAEDLDEWPALANGFCEGIRQEQAVFAPCAYAEPPGLVCPPPDTTLTPPGIRSCPAYDRF